MSKPTQLLEYSQKSEPCLIKVQLFEGPLDFLLHLIKKNEIDINDIPVAAITEQYIDYLELMKEMNLEIAGGYLVIAADLSLIKSKMLLPKPIIEENEIDPRSDLVKRLIQYQIYKDAASDLVNRHILGRDVFKREADESDPLMEEVEIGRVDLWGLIEAFRDFYKRRSYVWAEGIVYEAEHIKIEDKMQEVLEELGRRQILSLKEFLMECSSKLDLVITFLSLLELIRMQTIHIVQQLPDSSILVRYLGES